MTPVLVLVQYKSGPCGYMCSLGTKLQERARVGWSYSTAVCWIVLRGSCAGEQLLVRPQYGKTVANGSHAVVAVGLGSSQSDGATQMKECKNSEGVVVFLDCDHAGGVCERRRGAVCHVATEACVFG
jgi:hypothetical protein